MIDKEKLRRDIRNERETISIHTLMEKSKIISSKLFTVELYNKADCIYIYMDLNGEVPTREIIEDALSKGKKVAIPKILDTGMQFYYVNNINNDVETGFLGIQEPRTTNEIAEHEDPLIIMPGVAFDRNKNRLGHGGGFYDIYLSKNKRFSKVALAFDFQIFEEIPSDEHDIMPDIIITETEIIY